jgi:hypothetical protein
MRLILVPALGAAMMLAACDQAAEEPADQVSADVEMGNRAAEYAVSEPAPIIAPESDAAPPPAYPRIATNTEADSAAPGDNVRAPLQIGNGASAGDIDIGRPPQIAYVYNYGFRMPANAIASLQMQHADMCEAKGPDVCRIISLEHSGPEGEFVKGTLQLAVATGQARQFGRELTDAVSKAEGEQVSTTISGEDLAKNIVDTEAHLRARTVLRDRLMEVLRTRKGSVRELMDAEREVAGINREIDQATSALADMRGRAAFSRMNLSYESGSPSAGGFMDPIRAAAGDVGSTLGWFIAMLISLLTIVGPLVLIGLLIRFGWKRIRPLMPKRSDEAAA